CRFEQLIRAMTTLLATDSVDPFLGLSANQAAADGIAAKQAFALRTGEGRELEAGPGVPGIGPFILVREQPSGALREEAGTSHAAGLCGDVDHLQQAFVHRDVDAL